MVLATAVALTAGLSFAVWNDERFEFGEAHAGEDVMLVAVNHSDLPGLITWCQQRGIAVTAALSVFGQTGQGSLFLNGDYGRVEEGVAP
ncbi:MAG: hypothetical protein JWP85_1273 [Rhodoglobus sp.]|nr:hypothetical protein [Rhodoglobus sp.]